MTGAGLKDLAPLANLHTLKLQVTPVAVASLKDLVPLKKLHTLNLSNVTDETLRELRRIGLLHTLYAAEAEGGKRPKGPDEVVSLDLQYTRVTDAWLKELGQFKNLHTLDLSFTAVTNTGLNELAQFANLQSLNLSGTKVTGERLKELAPLTNLHTLNLSRVAVNDTNLKALAPLTNLHTLDLSFTQVTDPGPRELVSLKNLQTLNLSNTTVTDAGLRAVAPLTSLRSLFLSGTAVTDAGLKELAPLKHLQSLNLSRTAVTDAGLKELAPFQYLRTLTLERTQVTDETCASCAHRPAARAGVAHAEGGIVPKTPARSPTWICPRPRCRRGMKHLTGLRTSRGSIWLPPVTGENLKPLASLKKLTHLAVPITDDTLRALQEVGLLHCLVQAKARTTAATSDEESLLSTCPTPRSRARVKRYVGRLKNLATLNLTGTRVTAVGRRLPRRLPKCKIIK